MIETIFFDTATISIIFCAGLIVGFAIGCYIGMRFSFKRDIRAVVAEQKKEKPEN